MKCIRLWNQQTPLLHGAVDLHRIVHHGKSMASELTHCQEGYTSGGVFGAVKSRFDAESPVCLLEMAQSIKMLGRLRNPFCIIAPNYVKIGQAIAEI